MSLNSVEIILPDGSIRTFEKNPSALDVALSIGPRLAKDTVGVKVNGELEVLDLRLPLKSGSKIELITLKSPEANEVIRHSTAHILAQAVQSIWPDVKVTIGPVIDNGFFYDFDSPRSFSSEDLEKIEKKMHEIVKANLELKREVWEIDRAISVFQKMGERFKVEIIEELKAKGETTVSVYHQGDWFDLCRGPHLQSTGQVKALKLLKVAGAYWRGDEKNPMLQRIYGTAFSSAEGLEKHLKNIEEAEKRDHRKLGRELGLFHFHHWAPASPFFSGKGAIVYHQLQNYIRELYVKYGYQEIITPQIFDVELFKTSGHYENYKENMFFTQIDEREFASKPMNCPSHCLHFGASPHSYRNLPLRIADFGRLHRFEKSGAIHGLTRVRSFCQDDAHIFCTNEQIQSEIAGFIRLLNEVYQKLGMGNYKIYLSTRPEKRVGSDQVWDQAERALEKALQELNLPYTVNPGDGAFYGPKLDIMFVDALDRPWQLGTIQCDFNLPEMFKLEYAGEDNHPHRPVMLHRAILGSFERFLGVYLEHTAGHLPPWLSPTQVVVLNITDRVNSFCENMITQFKDLGIRAEFDSRNEKLNFKIREAQLQKIPYMIIVGDKEVEAGTVSVRLSDGKQFSGMNYKEVIAAIEREISLRDLNPQLKIETNQEVSH